MEQRKKHRRTLQNLRKYRAKVGKKTKKTVNKRKKLSKKLSKKYCRKVGGSSLREDCKDYDNIKEPTVPLFKVDDTVLVSCNDLKISGIIISIEEALGKIVHDEECGENEYEKKNFTIDNYEDEYECCIDGLLDSNGKRGSVWFMPDGERKYFVRYGDDYIDLVSESNIEKVNMENMEIMEINVRTTDDDDDLKIISVKPIDNIYEAILKGLGDIRFRHIKNNIYFGEDIIYSGPDATFEGYGIEDGATLNVNIRKKGFNEILDDIIELNPHLRDRREELMTYTEYDIDSWEELGEREITIDPEEPWCIKGHLDWINIGITRIPESFGDLKIDGDVLLDRNGLISLPVSFGDLEVTGDLHLNNNRFHFLPQNFYRISVGGTLMLTGNDLKNISNESSTKDTDLSKMKIPRLFPNVKGEVRVTA